MTDNNKISESINRPVATFAAIWIAVVGVIAYMFMPLMLGGLADDLGFTGVQLGFIGAAEAGGMALANTVAVFFIRKWNWRAIILVSGSLMVTSNLASMGLSSFIPMFIVRLVDGFAGGVLIALGVACQSDNENADRIFGYFIATEMTVASLGFYFLSDVKVYFGLDGIFFVLALISISGLLMALIHPARGLDRETMLEGTKGFGNSTISVSVIALTGALLFFVSQGGLWAFVERIGVAHNITGEGIGLALTISSVFGILGALGANWVARKVGRLNAFIFVLAGEILCICLLYGSLELWRYSTSMCLFILFWAMALPLMLSQFNVLDKSGRLIVLLYAMTKLGYALGPAIMGLLIVGLDFTYVITFALILCIVGLSVSIGLSLTGGRFRSVKPSSYLAKSGAE